jgi:hypothetical protein
MNIVCERESERAKEREAAMTAVSGPAPKTRGGSRVRSKEVRSGRAVGKKGKKKRAIECARVSFTLARGYHSGAAAVARPREAELFEHHAEQVEAERVEQLRRVEGREVGGERRQVRVLGLRCASSAQEGLCEKVPRRFLLKKNRRHAI